jgi:hypothetical protein
MNANKCTDEGTLAYTLVDSVDQRQKIHFCDLSWTLPATAGAVVADYSVLDPCPSGKMDAFTRVALYEITHYFTVGPATSLGQQIQDVANADNAPAYNPERAHGLVDIEQDNNPVLSETNAESYAWMALDAWVSRM